MCEVCIHDLLSSIPFLEMIRFENMLICATRLLTLWFESFVMAGVLFSTIPLRISANNCDRPLSIPFPFPLRIGIGGGGGGGGGDNTVVVIVDSFVIVSILWRKIH